MSHLLFLNTGTGRNLGDRAMLVNVLRLARQQLPDARLSISADAPAWLAEEFAAARQPLLVHLWGRWPVLGQRLRLPAAVIRLLAPLYRLMTTLACALLVCCPAALRRRLPGMEGDFVRLLAGVSCVYFNGGGYLTDEGRLEARALLLTALLARVRGARIVMTGQGLGPFNSFWTKWLLRRVVNSASCVYTREQQAAAECLRALGIADQRWQAGVDDACSLPATEVPAGGERPLLAVNCRYSSFHAGASTVADVLLEVIRAHLQRGFDIRLFVFQERENAELTLYRRWQELLPAERVEIVVTPDPRQLRARLAACDRAIGVAYHFALFALMAGLPLLSIYKGAYYRAKFAGLAAHFDRPDTLLDQAELEVATVLARLDAMSAPALHSQYLLAVPAQREACDRQILAALHSGTDDLNAH